MVIEAAYRVLSDDAEKIGFTYSGFALTSLPHKPLDELLWRREGHNLTMLIESGRDRSGKHIGLPYGSFARFILLFLQSEAIRTSCREVELGRSMRVWLGSMGLSIGGTTYKRAHEQARRISGWSLKAAGIDGRPVPAWHPGHVSRRRGDQIDDSGEGGDVAVTTGACPRGLEQPVQPFQAGITV
jgi:hypothetical protein